MAQSLRVVTAFGPFPIGQIISDPGQVAVILAAGYGPNVVDASAAAARPGLTIVVFGAPALALGATYDFALDLTTAPNTLYNWSGTAWVIILQAGVGGGTSPPLTAPGAISAAPTSSAVTASSLTIAWAAPTTGGAPADYLVQYKRSVDPTWITVDEASTQLAATVSGLLAATSYDVRVQATNSAGQGAVSPVLTVSTAAGATPDPTITTDLSNADRGLSPLIN